MTHEELTSLFVPHILERRAIFGAGKRLVHYTSAESAYKIIAGRQIWLRNAQMMNDYSEISHGIDCLIQAWDSPTGKELQAMLDRLKSGLRDELANIFDGHTDGLKVGTFILSLSEHDDDEDQLGRLSMWRAYGGRTGVALVLNNTAFAAETDEMHVFSSPVFYQDIPTFVQWFEGWARSIINAEEKLREWGADQVRNVLFTVFRAFALCTKHPGFSEEKEWRVYYSPVHEHDSDWIAPAVEIVNGVPQHLMKLLLKDAADRGVTGVAPATLLNRIIIGPCEYPVQVRAAIAAAMTEAGIENPLNMMWMSLIPYRH
jgi:hypothetical protein